MDLRRLLKFFKLQRRISRDGFMLEYREKREQEERSKIKLWRKSCSSGLRRRLRSIRNFLITKKLKPKLRSYQRFPFFKPLKVGLINFIREMKRQFLRSKI
jgi:hypothetical protein